jgi:hypothetical protein
MNVGLQQRVRRLREQTNSIFVWVGFTRLGWRVMVEFVGERPRLVGAGRTPHAAVRDAERRLALTKTDPEYPQAMLETP